MMATAHKDKQVHLPAGHGFPAGCASQSSPIQSIAFHRTLFYVMNLSGRPSEKKEGGGGAGVATGSEPTTIKLGHPIPERHCHCSSEHCLEIRTR